MNKLLLILLLFLVIYCDKNMMNNLPFYVYDSKYQYYEAQYISDQYIYITPLIKIEKYVSHVEIEFFIDVNNVSVYDVYFDDIKYNAFSYFDKNKIIIVCNVESYISDIRIAIITIGYSPHYRILCNFY